MKQLDIYILKKYLLTFLYSILVISTVAVVMDVSERIGKLVSSGLSFTDIATQYYMHFVPWINGELWPLFAFLSVIFFSSRLARDSEIIAMLSTGMSYVRILRPMLIGAVIVACLHWVGENHVIPISTYHMNEFKSEHISRSVKAVRSYDLHFFVGPTEKIYASSFNKRDTSIKLFRLESFDDDGRLVSIMKAENLKWKAYPNIWRAKNYELRTYDGLEEGIVYGKGMEMDTVIAITPGDFIRHSKQMEIMTSPDLKKYIKREQSKGLDNTIKFDIELYKRTAAPFTIIILTLIGAAIGTRKVRGGLGMHLALGVGLGAVYTVVSKFAETFANTLTIAPMLGVWIPNIAFGLLSIYLISRAQK